MAKAYPDTEPFVQAAEKALRKYRPNWGWDLLHLSELLLFFAQDGYASAWQALEEKYREIYLTEEGQRLAKLTSQKHRILRTLLQDVIGIDEKTANEDACAIEHVISDRSAEKILAYLEKQGL